jgi:hypothetical protein
MTIDRAQYLQVAEHYRRWNEAVILNRARDNGHLSASEAWQRYADVWEFCRRLSPEATALQHRQRLAAWQRYYADLMRFEEWRRRRGGPT